MITLSPGARRRLTALSALALPALLGGCEMVVMNPTGDVAVQQRDLILISLALMLIIIVPVTVLTVLFAWRYRARPEGQGTATYDPDFDHSTMLELVIWSCPLLIIIALGAVTWSSTHLLDPYRPLDRIAPGRPIPAGTKPLEIQVVALDWKWLFIYPAQGIATVNELALPVDVPVRFTLTSATQMNAFYAPTLAGMVYAMPGMQTELHAVLNKAGDSDGLSSNYTGAGFSDMRFKLRGLDQAGFDAWVAQNRRGGALQPATYLTLQKPSEKTPVMRFGSVTPGLFNRVVNQCVEPGRPCAADIMAHDMRGRGMGHDMQGPAAAAPAGGKPVPALMKDADEKGSAPNITKPRGDAPGKAAPGDQRNRNMTSNTPLPLPGAQRPQAA